MRYSPLLSNTVNGFTNYDENLYPFFLLLRRALGDHINQAFMDDVKSIDRCWGSWVKFRMGTHREDGPAMSFYSHNNDILFDGYRVRSAWHRTDGPSLIFYEKFFEAPK